MYNLILSERLLRVHHQGTYRITGNFGGGFNLAIWRLKSQARTVHNSHKDRSDYSIPHLHQIALPTLCEHIELIM